MPAGGLVANDRAAEVQLSTTYTPQQVRELLPANATILDYLQVQDQMLVLLLSHDRLQVVPVGQISRISTLLDLLQLQLSKLRLGADYVKSFSSVLLHATQTHLQELYQLLVGPIRESLAGGHLVISPHGILHHLPFHALFDGRQYLIDEFTVSYAPSASVYALCQARSAASAGPLVCESMVRESIVRESLVLGVPDPTVPFVQDEVEAVAACLPNSEVFLGQSATAERLRQKGPGSRFIHIATHGYFRRDNPMFSLPATN